MYAPTTVSSYIRSVAEFAQHFNKPPDQLGSEEIRSWQIFLLKHPGCLRAPFLLPEHAAPENRDRSNPSTPLCEETARHSEQGRGQGAARSALEPRGLSIEEYAREVLLHDLAPDW